MTCSFAHEDAAYVLGALNPSERLAFERHLVGCATCTRSVQELAGLPGLLSRVDPGVLEETGAEVPPLPPLPPTALPRLVLAARRERRRRTAVVAGLATAAAVLVTAVATVQLVGDEPARPPTATAPSGDTSPRVMAPVGDVPVAADLVFQQVTWGTRLELTCTYDTASVRYALPPAVDYVLVVRTRDGHVERVGSWRSVNGRTMRLTAGTAATPRQITEVQVRTPGGRVVLTAPV